MFCLIWYFVVPSTVYYCLPCVLPFLVFGHVFGCYKCLAVCSAVTNVWPFVQLLQMFARVFGCWKFLAVCSAVRSVGPCGRLLQALAVRSAVSSVGQFRFCYFLHTFISTLFYLSWALPIHFFLSCLCFPRGTFRFVHACFFSRSYIFSVVRFSFTFAACLFCFVFVGIFCFLLFPSFPRGLFLAFLRLSIERTSLSSLCLVFSPLGIVVFN